jgi:dolichyl-phosphate beta-glucosyltransferase
MSAHPYLSIIIPLHNESARLDDCMSSLLEYLWRQQFGEILLVENGSSDTTLERAQWWAEHIQTPLIRALSIQQRSKALAVQAGMLAAEGRYLYMADVDLSTPAEAIGEFFQEIFAGYDVVIGSRRVAGAHVHQSPTRALMGHAFSLMTAGLLPGLHDTQCGFKMFTRRARGLFRDLTITSMAFDVEVLLRARRAGLKVCELPVTWNEQPGSRVRPLRDGLVMLRDLWNLSRVQRNAQVVSMKKGGAHAL